MFVKALFTFLALFALVGCINSKTAPDTYYYILDNTPQALPQSAVANSKDSLKQVKVRQVVLPSYLNQPNLVVKLSDHQIKIANYHFWAEDLRQSIQQVLINELNLKNPKTSYTEMCVSCDELVITIAHFYPTENGDVLLSGSYYRTSSYTPYNFVLTSTLDQGGYDNAVSAMRALLGELAEQID